MKRALRSSREVNRVYSFGISSLTVCFRNDSPSTIAFSIFSFRVMTVGCSFWYILLFA